MISCFQTLVSTRNLRHYDAVCADHEHRCKVGQVDPIKPNLKPPGTKRLKLKCDILPSTSAFKFNLRRYSKVLGASRLAARPYTSPLSQLNLSSRVPVTTRLNPLIHSEMIKLS